MVNEEMLKALQESDEGVQKMTATISSLGRVKVEVVVIFDW